jgi:hypothetical protein
VVITGPDVPSSVSELLFREAEPSMLSRANPVMCGICATLAVLLVGSLVPVWVAWHFTPWEGVGTHGTLWQALAQLYSNIRDAGPHADLLNLHESNLIKGIILCAVAAGAGLGVFLFLGRRRASGRS